MKIFYQFFAILSLFFLIHQNTNAQGITFQFGAVSDDSNTNYTMVP